ncbi:hypothetical protein DQ04_08031010 [Trypanosoma grayi]|uniref:hypothetical protein n=1 Tax=Trypanosoma grayi TaxID=71804 RepID=UPI0004F4961C|nr:hypothetical protein DQ04_08031010 [Trypanosoma grayi]KEG08087.1 hypothetical protein DQ04_08031010 [Trypanosoma grayi]
MALTAPHSSLLRERIVDVDWEVDVLVASGQLARVGVPTVLLTLTLSSGIVLRYRLTVAELQQWRFTMAKVVRDHIYLERAQPPTGPSVFDSSAA